MCCRNPSSCGTYDVTTLSSGYTVHHFILSKPDDRLLGTVARLKAAPGACLGRHPATTLGMCHAIFRALQSRLKLCVGTEYISELTYKEFTINIVVRNNRVKRDGEGKT